MKATIARNLRILVVDDNRAVHEDFRKILCPAGPQSALENAEAVLFDSPVKTIDRPQFIIESAYQGRE